MARSRRVISRTGRKPKLMTGDELQEIRDFLKGLITTWDIRNAISKAPIFKLKRWTMQLLYMTGRWSPYADYSIGNRKNLEEWFTEAWMEYLYPEDEGNEDMDEEDE